MLALGERLLGDVAQDHRVVGLKLGQVGRQRVAADAARAVDPGGGQDPDLDLLLAQGLDQLGVLASRPLDQEDLGLAPGVGEPLGDVVDRPAIAAPLLGNELGGERVKVRFGDELPEREDVDAALQLDRLRLLVADGRRPVVVGLLENLERSPRRLAGADHDVDVDRLALLDVGGNRDLLDQDLAVVEVLERQDVDLHAQRLGGQGLLEEVAAVLVAVGEHDDAPGRVVGKRRQRQLDAPRPSRCFRGRSCSRCPAG